MMTHKKETDAPRLLAAALVVAASLLLGSLLHTRAGESVPLIWLTTATYMLGPIVASLIVAPATGLDRWLFLTAVLISLTIVIPLSYATPWRWATELMPQLGLWANVMFSVLLITSGSGQRPPSPIRWLLTAFYLMLLLAMPIISS